MKLSVIIPAYNEQDNIELFYKKFSEVFKDYKNDYELIFVDDGSKDETLKQIKKVRELDECIKAISFSRNFGKEAAMYAGLENSQGDYVAFIDADLQQQPETLLQMMHILEKNPEYDSVAACQNKRNDGKILSFFKKSFYSIINAITDVEFKQSASDFRIIRRKVANAIVDMKEYYRFSKGIFSWVGFNTCYIDYQAEKRANGKTKWSFTKLMKYAIEGIVAFTTLPLVIPILIGILAFITAIIMLIVSICVPNQLNIIITVVLFLFSMQFVFMGIIGEYLGHVYIENKNRPIYIIKEKIG